MRVSRHHAFAVVVAAVAAGALEAQHSGGAARLGVRAAAADSVAAFRAARHAQARFEVARRNSLPIRDAHGGPRCEVALGRYCYWYDATAPRGNRPEDRRVRRARAELLRTLDSLGARHPGDRWIAGQRVRYRIDGGDTTGAVRVAESGCAADGWWCAALRGYARHVAGDFAGAEAAFDSALVAMDERRRCEWDDPSVLLDEAARKAMERMPCAARRDAARRVWWLSQPLHAMEANDLRTELLSRRLMGELESDARLIYDTSYDWDNEELMLRYGWATSWTRERVLSGGTWSLPRLVGHEPAPAFAFPPGGRILLDTTAMPGPGDWNATDPSPTSRYSPRYARSMSYADAQVARFRRGDRIAFVAAFDASGDTLLGDAARVRIAVSAGPAPEDRAISAPQRATGRLSALAPSALAGASLVSIEVTDSITGGVARHRTGLPPLDSGRLRLSDLLLHAPIPEGDPVTRARPRPAALLPYVLPRTTITGKQVGIYWETYGVPATGESLAVAMTLERTSTPWLRRLAVRLGLAERASPLQIRWTEAPDASDGIAARSILVNVDDLAEGTYRVQLTVRARDGATASTERLVAIRR